jgi:hypothetical protein
VINPVPPEVVGSAVPTLYEIARVPEEMIGEPVTVRNDGTEAATEVTVPEVAGLAQVGVPEMVVRTWFAKPGVSDMFGVTPPVEFRGVDAVTAVTTPTRLPPFIEPVTSKFPFKIVLLLIVTRPFRNVGPPTVSS